MNCLKKVLLGATLLPLGGGLLMTSIFGPLYTAVQLGYDAMWGLPVTYVLWGAAAGGFSCWCDRKVARAIEKARSEV